MTFSNPNKAKYITFLQLLFNQTVALSHKIKIMIIQTAVTLL